MNDEENIDWFNFENKDLDFPFYKKNPHMPKWGWLVLIIFILPIGLLLSTGEKVTTTAFSCLLFIVPILYFLNWDYKAIFQKPKAKEIGLAVALFVGYLIYAMLMGTILETFGIVSEGLVSPESINLYSIIPLLFSIMSEEFIKFIPFIFFLRIFFKYTNRRKLSVIISVLLVMAFFACLHAYNFKMLIFALFIQGFGSIFEYIGYIKTKNIWISYTTHICTDVFIYLLTMMGF